MFSSANNSDPSFIFIICQVLLLNVNHLKKLSEDNPEEYSGSLRVSFNFTTEHHVTCIDFPAFWSNHVITFNRFAHLHTQSMKNFFCNLVNLSKLKERFKNRVRSDFIIPGHLLTYPSTLLRTKHVETNKKIIQIEWDANKWLGTVQPSIQPFHKWRNTDSDNLGRITQERG